MSTPTDPVGSIGHHDRNGRNDQADCSSHGGPRSTDPAVAAYLSALDVRLEAADAEVRSEILADIGEHIEARLDDLGHLPAPTEVQEILAGLGSPLEVADEVLRRASFRPPRRFFGRWIPASYLALSVFGAALVLAIDPETSPQPWFWPTGWALIFGAIVLMCLAPLWKSLEKVLGILAGLGVTFAAFMILGFADTDGALRTLLGVLAVVVALVVPALLAVRAWRRSPAMS